MNRMSRIYTDTPGLKEFYFNYDGDVKSVEDLDPASKSRVVFAIDEAAGFTGVPAAEWERLIEEKKISCFVCGITLIPYPDVKNVKYWWDEYQKELKEAKQ